MVQRTILLKIKEFDRFESQSSCRGVCSQRPALDLRVVFVSRVLHPAPGFVIFSVCRACQSSLQGSKSCPGCPVSVEPESGQNVHLDFVERGLFRDCDFLGSGVKNLRNRGLT